MLSNVMYPPSLQRADVTHAADSILAIREFVSLSLGVAPSHTHRSDAPIFPAGYCQVSRVVAAMDYLPAEVLKSPRTEDITQSVQRKNVRDKQTLRFFNAKAK